MLEHHQAAYSPTWPGGRSASTNRRPTGMDVFVYFNNDGYGHAARNAEKLAQLLAALGLDISFAGHSGFPIPTWGTAPQVVAGSLGSEVAIRAVRIPHQAGQESAGDIAESHGPVARQSRALGAP